MASDDFDYKSDPYIASVLRDYAPPAPVEAIPAVKQNTSALGDFGTGLKRGVEQIPGMLTGLADIPFAAAFNARPFTQGAEAVGRATGFEPGKWAEEAQKQYSPQYQQSAREVNAAWEDPNTSLLEKTGAVLAHPRYLAGQITESLPSMAIGGVGSRALMTAGRMAVPAVEGAIARTAPGYLERAAGEKWATPVAAGVGEGGVQTGQLMEQEKGLEDQRRAATGALMSGAVDALIGIGAGRVAQKMGLETVETRMARGLDDSVKTELSALESKLGRTGRIAGGALSEGVLQELPQSAQEQVWQNWTEKKPLWEGVPRQAIEGMLAGAAMGAGVNIRGAKTHDLTKPAENAAMPQAAPTLELPNLPQTVDYTHADGSVEKMDPWTAAYNDAEREVSGTADTGWTPETSKAHQAFVQSGGAERTYAEAAPTDNVRPYDPEARQRAVSGLMQTEEGTQNLIDYHRSLQQSPVTEQAITALEDHLAELKKGAASAFSTKQPVTPRGSLTEKGVQTQKSLLSHQIGEYLGKGLITPEQHMDFVNDLAQPGVKTLKVKSDVLKAIKDTRAARVAETQAKKAAVEAEIVSKRAETNAVRRAARAAKKSAVPVKESQNAIQKRSAAKEVPLAGKPRKVIAQGGEGVGQGKQGIETAVPSEAKKEVKGAKLKAKIALAEEKKTAKAATKEKISAQETAKTKPPKAQQQKETPSAVKGETQAERMKRTGRWEMPETPTPAEKTAVAKPVEKTAPEAQKATVDEKPSDKGYTSADQERIASRLTDISTELKDAAMMPDEDIKALRKERGALIAEATEKGYNKGKVTEQLFSETAETENPTTAVKLTKTLKDLFRGAALFDKIVKIYATQEEAAVDGNLSGAKGRVLGFKTPDGKVGLIAENIEDGKELGVFLHEVGVHLGMEKLVGKANMRWLDSRILEWSALNDGSKESEAAKTAVARSEESTTDDNAEGRIAYMTEELVNRGVKPSALGATPAIVWFRRLFAGLKSALRRLGFRSKNFSGQNLVDLAYGAAHLELSEASGWHGTAVDFRKFNHVYMNSGEGAQAFGWGTYIAQRVGIAKDYWRHDVSRKKESRQIDDYPEKATLKEALKNDDYLGFDSSGDALGAILDHSDWKDIWEASPELEAAADKWKAWTQTGKPQGSLMRVASTVHADEMLNWDKPLSEQSEKVKAALDSIDWDIRETAQDTFGDPDPSGRELYSTIASIEDSKEAASKYLDSIGIKGIKFLDQPSRQTVVGEWIITETNTETGRKELFTYTTKAKADAAYKNMTSEVDALHSYSKPEQSTLEKQTSNIVIFNDKNIVRVATQVGADIGKVKFSEATRSVGNEDVINSFLTSAREHIPTAKSEFVKYAAMMPFTRDLAKWASKYMPAANNLWDAINSQMSDTRKLSLDVHAVSQSFLDLKPSGQDLVQHFLHDGKMSGKWGFQPEWLKGKLTSEGKQVTVPMSPEMAKAWGELKTSDKQAAKVAEATLKLFYTLRQEEIKAVQTSVEDFRRYADTLQDPETQKSVLADVNNQLAALRLLASYQGPYVPTLRFGDYYVKAKSTAYLAAEAAEDVKAMTSMKADGKNYVYTHVQSQSAANALAKDLSAKYAGGKIEALPIKGRPEARKADYTALLNLESLLKKNADKKGAGQVREMLNTLLNAMSDEHAESQSRQQFKAVYGANYKETMRGAAMRGQQMAFKIGALKNARKASNALFDMGKQADDAKAEDKASATHLLSEFRKRYEGGLDGTETSNAIQSILGGVSLWKLLTNPMYYLTQLAQPYQYSIPSMVKYGLGYNASWKAMFDERKTLLEVWKKSGGVFRVDEDLSWVKNAKERGMLEWLRERNLLDMGMESEVGALEGANPAKQAIEKWAFRPLRNAVQNTEIVNRVSTALAAYKLAIRQGKTENQAREIVENVLHESHGQYAGTNAPRYLNQKGAMRIPMQFRKFQLIQATFLFQNIWREVQKLPDPIQRAAAARTIAATLGHTLAVAGLRGSVLWLVVQALVTAAGVGAGDDDKDPRDVETKVHDWLSDNASPAFADFVMFGAPTVVGVNISARMGLNPLTVLPFDNQSVLGALSSMKDFKENAFALGFGAAGSTVADMIDGFDMMSQGKIYKGLEKTVPSAIKNLMQAGRYATEGVTKRNGDVTLKPDEVTWWDTTQQALGAPSARVKEIQRKTGAVHDITTNFKTEADKLKSDYVSAFEDKDVAGMKDARDEWLSMSASMRKLGLKPQPITTMLKAPMEKRKRERNVVSGVETSKQTRGLLQNVS